MLHKYNYLKKYRIIESARLQKYNNLNLSEGIKYKLDPVMRALVVKSLPANVLPDPSRGDHCGNVTRGNGGR